MLHLDPLDPLLVRGTKKNYNNNNNIGRFPGGGLENQNPARTIAHSPPGVKETLNYVLREKTKVEVNICLTLCTKFSQELWISRMEHVKASI